MVVDAEAARTLISQNTIEAIDLHDDLHDKSGLPELVIITISVNFGFTGDNS
ncbi:hypothetical protein GCM10009001_34160 [Virgibacillus siamensis]|uniref:Uncharacterized protein n=1 Tax=Virgibacillus siamensis TaxID=480071 RepID=A0ABP3RP97_9BACI